MPGELKKKETQAVVSKVNTQFKRCFRDIPKYGVITQSGIWKIITQRMLDYAETEDLGFYCIEEYTIREILHNMLDNFFDPIDD